MLIIICIISKPLDVVSAGSTHMTTRSLNVSPFEVALSLRQVEDVLHEVIHILEIELNIANSSDHSHLSNAISTYSNLLGMSLEEVVWCISALKSTKGILKFISLK